MKLGKLFHIFKVKAENGLDKLVSAETKLEVALADNMAALERQKGNSKTLFAAQRKFQDELEKVRKESVRYKTQVEVLKNKGLKKEDDDMRLAVAQYLENKKLLEDLELQEKQINLQAEKVEKMLKKLNLNKALLESKAAALKTKIEFYKISSNITEEGLVDIDNMFEEVDSMVKDMEYLQDADRRVTDLVKGNTTTSARDAEIDSFIDSL